MDHSSLRCKVRVLEPGSKVRRLSEPNPSDAPGGRRSKYGEVGLRRPLQIEDSIEEEAKAGGAQGNGRKKPMIDRRLN